jgi:hypothetical protein
VGLWQTVRGELAGALRSARYDVDRHRAVRRALRLATAETSEYAPRPRPYPTTRPPYRDEPRSRRVVTTTGVALLVAGGAAGTYLAVAGGLTALTADQSAQPAAGPTPQPFVATQPRPLAPSAAGRRAAPVRPFQGGGTQQDAGDQVLPAPLVDGYPSAYRSGSPESTPSPSCDRSPTASPSASEDPTPSQSVTSSSSASYGAGQTSGGR